MGGILAKQLLIDWKVGSDPRSMTPRVIGVMMLGVPAQGSPLASGVLGYLNKILGIDHYVGLCHRRGSRILFASDENSYLGSLEGEWTDLLTSLRSGSRSQLPMLGCAYESAAQVRLAGYRVEVVPKLYAATQCSMAQFPIARPHTELPKPNGPDDDVHGPWLVEDLRLILGEWNRSPLSTFEFASDEPTLKALHGWVNTHQTAFRLDVDDEVIKFRPKPVPYQGGNTYSLVRAVATSNPEICMEASFPPGEQTIVTLRKKGSCLIAK